MNSVHGKSLVTVVLALLVLLHAPGNHQGAYGQQLPGAEAASSRNVLWYRKPAVKWTEALPLGNGRLGAMVFGAFLAVTRLPFELAGYVAGLNVNRYTILVIIIVLYLVLGAVMDIFSIVVLTVPIFFPVIQALDFDPIWFGIIVVRLFEMGAITPPIGINVFVLKGVAKDLSLGTIFRGIVPFFIADLFHVALLIAVPEIATFLPGLMS